MPPNYGRQGHPAPFHFGDDVADPAASSELGVPHQRSNPLVGRRDLCEGYWVTGSLTAMNLT